MNFLAHLYLSGDDPDIILGNLIADSVKGNDLTRFKTGVQEGIRLHRGIDCFTDCHPTVMLSKEIIRPKYHKFTGVVVDMYYDHFLAANWEKYSKDDLYDVTVKAYEILLRNFMILPARIRRILPFMLASNWLYSYRDLNMMKRYFAGMARRASFYSGMEHAVDDLKAGYDIFYGHFESFLPEIREYAGKLQAELCQKEGEGTKL